MDQKQEGTGPDHFELPTWSTLFQSNTTTTNATAWYFMGGSCSSSNNNNNNNNNNASLKESLKESLHEPAPSITTCARMDASAVTASKGSPGRKEHLHRQDEQQQQQQQPLSEAAAACRRISKPLAYTILVAIILLATTIIAMTVSPSIRHALLGTPHVDVAFIGNSIMYYYDLPRSISIVSDGRVRQNSCLSGAGSLVRMPGLENGMWNRGRASGAYLYTDAYGKDVHDLGACSMDMLLFGYNHTAAQAYYDEFWEGYRTEYGVTDDDYWKYDWGSDLDPRLNNACAQSQAYLNFLNSLPSDDIRKAPPKAGWDYVVLVDRTAGPRTTNSRAAGVEALHDIYLDYLDRTGATPIFLVTAAYWTNRNSDNNNDNDNNDNGIDDEDEDDDEDNGNSATTSLVDAAIPYWTVETYQGYKVYAEFLRDALPRSKKPKLVNMGIAYLVVYEENLDMWQNSMFWTDHKHPSPSGNFLESCLLHHAIYSRLPYRSTMIRADMASLWNGTRNLMYPRDGTVPYPTTSQAEYLYGVCQRVAGGYIPPTFRELMAKNEQSLYE